MPRKTKLTWQAGADHRRGRWRKRYLGKTYYFDGGRGKSDAAAYDKAVKEWEAKKVAIDEAAPRRHQEDYESAIAIWDEVLTWSRQHGDEEMAELSIEKLAHLRKVLDKPTLLPLDDADRFEGQFQRSVRYPSFDRAIREIAESFQTLPQNMVAPAIAVEDLSDQETPAPRPIPTIGIAEFGPVDPLKKEKDVWDDRLAVMRGDQQQAVDRQLSTHIDGFLAAKQAQADAGELTKGRVYTLRLHLTHFREWRGGSTAVDLLDGSAIVSYRQVLLEKVGSQEWSRATAKDRLRSVISFLRWLWEMEVIEALPRVVAGKAESLKIASPSSSVIIFDKPEIATLLQEASERTKLYILLILNTGMLQKDIADLRNDEVDWQAGRITRKRSKTRRFDSVPEVSYLLWPATFDLFKKHAASRQSELALLNERGEPLWTVEISADGKMKKNDNIRTAFERLKKKTKIKKPLKSLKKTSATMLRNNERFASLERVFLGHAPQSMSDKHYTLPPQDLLDKAVAWLGTEFKQ